MASVIVSDLDRYYSKSLIQPCANSSTPILFQPSMSYFITRLVQTFHLINDSFQNRLLGWELANSQGNHTIPQPVLAIYPKGVRSQISALKQNTLITLIFIAL